MASAPHPVAAASTHKDRFVCDRLPAAELWPQLVYPLPEQQVPEQANLVVCLLDAAVASGHAERPLLRDAQQHLSYAQTLARVQQTQSALQRLWQLPSGSRVLLRGGNSIELAIAWLAVVRAGWVAVASMPLLRAKELGEIVAKAQIRHALCADAWWQELANTQAQQPQLQHGLALSALCALADQEAEGAPAHPSASADVALLAFTSGTTGQPKAAAHTHQDVLAACAAWPAHVLRATPDDVVVGTPPLAFTFGLGGLLLFPMAQGASVYFHDKAYTPESLIAVIKRCGATICYTAPTFYRQMAAHAQAQGIGTLRCCVSAGEGLPTATRQLWRNASCIEMIDGIGATEMFHIFISSAGAEVREGAVGRVVPGYEAKVVDAQGQEVPRGTVGQLAVRGCTGCKYLDDARQAIYVTGGWNHPGDAFMQDADGYFWYQARSDDMIITAGYNVGGPEVEDCLLKHPAVAECGVIGVPDEERGMRIKAVVVTTPGHEPNADLVQALQDHVKSTLAPFKYPREVQFVPALPRTETGKLQRFKLRELYANTLHQP